MVLYPYEPTLGCPEKVAGRTDIVAKAIRKAKKPAYQKAETAIEPPAVNLESTTALTPVEPVIVLSEEQVAIANKVRNGKKNILVRARAGTGKTFLLRNCIPLMSGEIAVCAYNRKIAKEIRFKVEADGYLRNQKIGNQSGADVGTFHSYGFQTIIKVCHGIRLEGYEGRNSAGFYKFNVIADRLAIPQPLRSVVRKMAERAMERGFGIDGMISMGDQAAWLDLINHFAFAAELPEDGAVLAQMLGIEGEDWRTGMMKRCCRFAAQVISTGCKMVFEKFTKEVFTGRGANRRKIRSEEFTGVISFTEMMYLPLKMNMPLPQYDWVLVDEAQDSNPLRREMARRMLKAGGRMMWVGDNRQAIYAFSGADSDSLDLIAQQFNCEIMPMTVTFRCAKAIVRDAQEICPDYKAANDNPEGEILAVTESEFDAIELMSHRPSKHETGDAIICRNTAPLVELAYKLYGRGVQCHVEGKDIGRGLVELVGRWPNLKNLPALTDKLNDYKTREVAELLAQKKEFQADQLEDQIETIFAIIKGLPQGSNVATLVERVNLLFADTTDEGERKSVTLLTIHRSKGLEFTRTFLWGNERFMPSKYARQDWQLEQELNLDYVSRTRAIMSMVRVKVA